MKLLYHVVEIKLNDKEVMLINTLSGRMDVINDNESAIFAKWKNGQQIYPANEVEYEFYGELSRVRDLPV